MLYIIIGIYICSTLIKKDSEIAKQINFRFNSIQFHFNVNFTNIHWHLALFCIVDIFHVLLSSLNYVDILSSLSLMIIVIMSGYL